MLEKGPTSTLPVLDRFIRGLMAAGAKQVRVLHPTCTGCRRRRPPNAKVAGGWRCNTCYARGHTATCAGCATGAHRRPDPQGRPLCSGCLARRRRQATRPADGAIVDHVRTADPTLEPAPSSAGRCRGDTNRPSAVRARCDAAAAGPLHDLQRRPRPIRSNCSTDFAEARRSLPPAACHACQGPAQPLVATQAE